MLMWNRFRWVELQLQALQPLKLAADIEWRLGHLPKTLEDSYWVIYQRIQNAGPHAFQLATFTFQLLLYCQKSFSVENVATLASIALESEDPSFSGTDVLDVCENLVATGSSKDDILGFTHLSVREFLEGLESRSIIDFRKEEGNAGVAIAGLRYLGGALDKELTLPDWELPGQNFPSILDIESSWPNQRAGSLYVFNSGFSDYVINSWPEHLQRSGELMRASKPLQHLWESFFIHDKAVSLQYKNWCVFGAFNACISWGVYETYDAPLNPAWIAVNLEMLDVLRWLYAINYAELVVASWSKNDPLFIAVKAGKQKVVECILEQTMATTVQLLSSAPGDSIDPSKNPLSEAARKGDLDITTTLVEKASPSAEAIKSACIAAGGKGQLEVLRFLFNRLDDPRHETKARILVEAASGGHCGVMSFLIDQGLQVGPSNVEALNSAIVSGHKEAVSILLENGVYSDGGPGPLCTAIRNNRRDIFAMLVLKSPRRDSLSKALIVAVSQANLDMANRLDDLGAEEEGPAVIRAIKTDNCQTAINLINFGYDVQGRYLERFRTALHWAAEKGFLDVVKALLQHGAAPNIYDTDRNTALHLSAKKGHTTVVKALLGAGADSSAKDKFGLTPADLAAKHHHEDTANVLNDWSEEKLKAPNSEHAFAIEIRSSTISNKDNVADEEKNSEVNR